MRHLGGHGSSYDGYAVVGIYGGPRFLSSEGPGSARLGRSGVSVADACEVLCRCPAAKGLMRPMVVEAVGEGVDVLLFVDAVRQVEAGVELVSP